MRTRTVLPTLAVPAGALALRRQVVARMLGLRPPQHRVRVERDVGIPTADGERLATDVYRPVGLERGPVVLIRTPYGRTGWAGAAMRAIGNRLAERGYHTVMQDVRGRFDSSGDFTPYVNEADDGRATVEWTLAQPWCDGQIATWGPSYLGYTQWAAAAAAGDRLAALVPITTSADIGTPDADGTFALDTIWRWLVSLDALSNRSRPWRLRVARITSPVAQQRALEPLRTHLPLATLDEVVLEEHNPVWRWLTDRLHPTHPVWPQTDHREVLDDLRAPVHMVTGWYDLFTGRQLAEYERLQAAGADPYLTVGPWGHLDFELQATGLREGIIWFDAHLRGDRSRLRERPVRIHVGGLDEWRDLDAWPPPSTPLALHLRAGGGLRDEPSRSAPAPQRYVFDPDDATPALAGALLSRTAGTVDNATLEARDDVLVFTTEPLQFAWEVIGTPRVVVRVGASAPHVDLVVRLCDVHPGGRSLNLADGHRRLAPGTGGPPPGGTSDVEIGLSALAHRFLPGHAVRLQIASGAHPRVPRNLGTGEPALHGVDTERVEVSIHTDGSCLELPLTLMED